MISFVDCMPESSTIRRVWLCTLSSQSVLIILLSHMEWSSIGTRYSNQLSKRQALLIWCHQTQDGDALSIWVSSARTLSKSHSTAASTIGALTKETKQSHTMPWSTATAPLKCTWSWCNYHQWKQLKVASSKNEKVSNRWNERAVLVTLLQIDIVCI